MDEMVVCTSNDEGGDGESEVERMLRENREYREEYAERIERANLPQVWSDVLTAHYCGPLESFVRIFLRTFDKEEHTFESLSKDITGYHNDNEAELAHALVKLLMFEEIKMESMGNRTDILISLTERGYR